AAERVDGDPFTRIAIAVARLWGGRTTRWVDTNFRALVLEPGFLSMLFVKGFWRRLTQPAAAPPQPDAVIVAGGRFTAGVRHLQRLAARAAHAAPRGQLLTSNDVTAYNRVLVDTVRRFGLTSIGIQHGMTCEPNGHSIVHVDALAAWGNETELWHRAQAPQKA